MIRDLRGDNLLPQTPPKELKHEGTFQGADPEFLKGGGAKCAIERIAT